MAATNPTWTLQRAKRPKGWYYQALRSSDRKSITLGYLSDDEAEQVRENLSFWSQAQEGKLFGLETSEIKRALLANPSDATDAIEFVEQQVAVRQLANADYSAMTLADYQKLVWLPVREAESAKKTVQVEKWAWSRILPVLGDVPLAKLDAIRWSRFMAAQTDVGGHAKVRLQNTYRVLLNHAVEMGAIKEVHSFRAIKGASEKSTPPGEALTGPEVQRLLEHAPSAIHRALYAMMFGQGFRPGEVTKVHWSDINWAAGTIHVKGSKNPKANAIVAMTPPTRKELEPYWISLGRPTEGPCFLNIHGKPLTRWVDLFLRTVKAAGLDKDAKGNRRKITPYSGRYTFATLAVMAGVPDGAVRSMMRHSANSTMLEEIYQRLQVKQVAEAFASFPTFDDKP